MTPADSGATLLPERTFWFKLPILAPGRVIPAHGDRRRLFDGPAAGIFLPRSE